MSQDNAKVTFPLSFMVSMATIAVAVLSSGCATDTRVSDGAADVIEDVLPAEAFEPAPGSRRWLGPGYWANRLHDWQYSEGLLECEESASWLPMRNVHDLVHDVVELDGPLEVRARVERLNMADDRASDAAAGFLLGVGPEMDPRARSFIFEHYATGGGLFAGVDSEGRCFIRDNDSGEPFGTPDEATSAQTMPAMFDFSVRAEPAGPGEARVELVATTGDAGDELCGLSQTVPRERLVGGFAIVSHPGTRAENTSAGRFGFRDWTVSGEAVQEDLSRGLGPIITTQYTTSRSVLKLNAQLMPIGPDDPDEVHLEMRRSGSWTRVATERLERPSLTALFRIEDWYDEDVPYRVVYDLPTAEGFHAATFTGLIRAEPPDAEALRVGVLGCTIHHPWLPKQDWNDTVFFPHQDLAARVRDQDPELLFFYGDQLYEGTPSGVDELNYEEDYLYKWYLWAWSFRDLTRSIPTITIPDDHDVYQGNLWGEGGRSSRSTDPSQADSSGGYQHPPRFVNLVHRTQTAHLPDPFDPAPIEQNISVYFTDLVYARVSFAILADRMFKSGPDGHGLPPSGTSRADHYNNPAFDTATLDRPGLVLLGERQLAFLEHWVRDWTGVDMKVVLSSSPFANLATHHGREMQYLMADLDSNGWPQSGRDRALRLFRQARAVQITGDQHLATVVQHGIDEHDDAVWNFTAPAISNAYARAFAPHSPGEYTWPELSTILGPTRDGFGNLVTMHAVANPGRDMGTDWATLNDQVPGFGMLIVDKAERTYTFECWPRSEQVAGGGQYEGWPITVRQADNDGRAIAGYLPEISVSDSDSPVVKVFATGTETDELEYAMRMPSNRFRLPVYQNRSYRVEISDDRDGEEILELTPAAAGEEPSSVEIRLHE